MTATQAGPSRFELLRGASWLTEGGVVIPVPGFHEDWIRTHGDLVGDCRNVCDVVLRLGWISVASFSEGYVELFVPDRRDAGVRARLERLLRGAAGRWSTALVMSMDEEGYVLLKPEDLEDPEGFGRKLLAGA
ncbi:MAG: hypothetical protein JNG85_10430 [Spirochaetaceae bacterium]|nr:hypothetical protein [Spirochaetaceae bacterium]